MHRSLVKHPVLYLQVRACERVRGALADGIHAARRERGAEQVAGELADPAIQITLIGGSSATWWRPNRRLGRRSSAQNSRPHPPHADG